MSAIKLFPFGIGRLATAALLLFMGSSGSVASDRQISIVIAPSPIETPGQGTELKVALTLADHRGEPLFLGFRNHWGPVIDVADNIHDLEVDNGFLKHPIPEERRENWRIIKVEPRAADEPIHVRYQVGLGDNPPSDADAIDVRAGYLHAIGTTFLPKFCLTSGSDWDCFDSVSATFDWSAFANRAIGPGRSSDHYAGS